MNAAKCRAIFETLREVNPAPTTELEYSSPFELLIAVLLSAQATDVGVNKATRRLFPVAHTPQQMLDLGEAGLSEYIKTIGLYKTKAKHVIETCRIQADRDVTTSLIAAVSVATTAFLAAVFVSRLTFIYNKWINN